jgi:hypothetical protein
MIWDFLGRFGKLLQNLRIHYGNMSHLPMPPSHLTAAKWKVIALTKGLFPKRATDDLDSHIGKMDNAKK